MIVHREEGGGEEGGRLVLVTQSDHARFSGELLSLWRTDDLPAHPRRRELLFAVREHDNGWWEADAVPRVAPETGRPHDFLSMPREVRFEVWERGTARHAAEHPYVALLITHHALYLHRDRRGEPGFEDFLDRLALRYEELSEAAGADAATVEEDYRFLDLADLVSLVVCNRWRDPFERRGMSGRLEGDRLHLDPFPLAGTTTFEIPARRIPERPYRGDADLAAELAAARWESLAVKVAAG